MMKKKKHPYEWRLEYIKGIEACTEHLDHARDKIVDFFLF